MFKTTTNSELIQSDERIVRKNVTSLTISNYDSEDMSVTMNNVTEVIPPYDEVNRYARSFDIPGDGSCSDMDITIAFVGGIGKAVLRYRTYNPKKC